MTTSQRNGYGTQSIGEAAFPGISCLPKRQKNAFLAINWSEAL